MLRRHNSTTFDPLSEVIASQSVEAGRKQNAVTNRPSSIHSCAGVLNANTHFQANFVLQHHRCLKQLGDGHVEDLHRTACRLDSTRARSLQRRRRIRCHFAKLVAPRADPNRRDLGICSTPRSFALRGSGTRIEAEREQSDTVASSTTVAELGRCDELHMRTMRSRSNGDGGEGEKENG